MAYEQQLVPSQNVRAERGALSALLLGAAAAIVASPSCLGPILLMALGVSGAWIGTMTRLETYRSYFVVAGVMVLLFAGARIFRPVESQSDNMPRSVGRVYKILFGSAVLLVLGSTAFPYLFKMVLSKCPL
jgi:mercuric ion transport protein